MLEPDLAPESTRFFRPEISQVLWAPTLSNPAAPSYSELNVGTELSSEVADWSGWMAETSFVDVPDLNERFTAQVSGHRNSPASSITLYLSRDGVDLRALFTRGARGFIVISDTGFARGRADVFQVEVGSVSKARDLDKAAQFTVSFAILKEPWEDVVIPLIGTLLQENFGTKPNGGPGVPAVGGAWMRTGTNMLEVNGGKLALPAGGTNGYANSRLATVPKQITGTFYFSTYTLDDGATPPVICLICHGEDSFHGADMGLHLVITPTQIAYQIREDNQIEDDDGNPGFPNLLVRAMAWPVEAGGPALPPNTPIGVIVEFREDGVWLTGPDGVVNNPSTNPKLADPRIKRLIGPNVAVQDLRLGTGSQPYWLTVHANT